MAEVGEYINWGYPEEGEPIFFRIGHGNELIQAVDTLSRHEWLAQEMQVRLTEHEQRLRERIADGQMDPMSEEQMWDELSRLEAEINSEAGILFAAEEWLSERPPVA